MVTHSVDDRRPTLVTRLYVAGMWAARDKRAFEGAARTLRTARARQRAGDRPPTPRTRLRTRTSSDRRHGMTTWTVWPRRARPVVRVLYLHGGGYVHPLTVDYWRLVRALVRTPAEVVVPAYPLAPDAGVDDVLPLLEDLAAELVTGELPVVLMGDSAGGALVLEVARALADRGTPPAHVVGLSPWLDAALDEREIADLEATDPMLAESGLRAAGRWWAAPYAPGHPRVSPVGLDLAGLPPITVHVGDRDILRPAVDRLLDRARVAHAIVHLHEVTAMFHVWMTRPLPEARRTRRQIVHLLRRVATGPALRSRDGL